MKGRLPFVERILFVCTGNTCRSPMAEALLKSKVKDVEVQSAGIHALTGSPASMNALGALKEKGINFEHQSQALTEDLIHWASVILTMTNNHKQVILNSFPELKDKVYTLSEFVNEDELNLDIIDPFGGSLEMYQSTAKEIDQLVDKLIKKL